VLVVCFLFLCVVSQCRFVLESTKEIVPSIELLESLPEVEAEKDTFVEFVEFAKKYGKSYGSVGEMVYRLRVFKINVVKALRMNEESQKIGGAKFGVTKFSDLTDEEFKSKYLMRKMPSIPKEKMYPNYLESNRSIMNLPPGGPPAQFDWRNHNGAVTGVYNQGSCGSCWAFSATENHESRFALQHNRGVQSLSVQQILDCDDPSQYGCNGGWPYQAWEYIQSQGGQDSLQCYPYEGIDDNCRWNPSCNSANIVSWTWVFPHNEYQMLLWVLGNSPLSICVDASQWSSYSGGIVASSQCRQQTDHCVLITGWNMNSNPPYWIVRNSWGTDWGDGGYIYLQYNANTCALAQYPASCHTVNG